MLKTEIIKNCEFCGDEITVTNPKAKYCGNSCKTKANLQRRENEQIEAENARKKAEFDEANRIAEAAKRDQISQIVAGLGKRRIKVEEELEEELEQKRLIKVAEDLKQQKANAEIDRINKEISEKEKQDYKNKILLTGVLLLGAAELVDTAIKSFNSNSRPPDPQSKPVAFLNAANTLPPAPPKTSGPIQNQGNLPSFGYIPKPDELQKYWGAPQPGKKALPASTAKHSNAAEPHEASKIIRSL